MASHFRSGLRGEDIRAIRGRLRLTRWAMWAETIVRAFWPVLAFLCFVFAVGLLGGFAALGPIGHRLAIAVAVMVLAVLLIYGGMKLQRPTRDDVAARLDESDRRRPLATLKDDLAVGRGADGTETVWLAHRERARAALRSLTTRWPDLRVSGTDTWGLRLLAPVLLVGALIASGGALSDRLAAAVAPGSVTAPEIATFHRDPVAEAWFTPPAYTGLSTIYLDQQDTATATPIEVPQGSEITIRVTDAPDQPTLEGGALAGIEGFATLGGGLAEARGIVSSSGALSVSTGGTQLGAWEITMIPDAPPEIELHGEPYATQTRALDLAFKARDDYGVMAAWAEIAPEGHDPENAKGLPLPMISFGLPMPLSGDSREIEDSAIRDFTAHPWAGAEVSVTLYAEDGAGQVSDSGRFLFTLPGRQFFNPIARALVEQRRDLALDYGQADRVLDVLQAVTRRPDELFDDAGVYLVVRTAIRRLATGVGTETVPDTAPEVIEFLWQAALALEDGDLSNSLERLRQAQDALREALENGSEEDIRRAMDELRAALNEYLQQLAQQSPQNPNQHQGQMDPNQMLSQQDLQEMLDRMQEQAESGARDQARQMLSELNRLLENLQSAQRQQGQSPGQQALQDLQEMIQRQRDLSDRTFDEQRMRQREQQLGQNGQQGRQPGQQGQQQPGWGEGQGRGDEHGRDGQQGGEGRGEGQMPGQSQGQGGLAEEQEALRRELENLARGLGSDDAARALEDAARAMGQAREDLEQGANSDAVRDQMDALDRLNEGAEALAQQTQQGQGETPAQGNRDGEGQGRDNAQNDPFDRPSSAYGPLDGRATKVPDQQLIDRARELMDELRRRAAEPSRPELELEYLDRLMERF